MPTDHRAKLANIKRFDQLIAYLRDEMGWPIGRDSFEEVDDLFYEFTADELGIDPKTAAKIQEIKRLRPLSAKQPWGIFFVKFEPKRLPVVALRRILGQVALKKRASANNAERAAWAADDLLFVSNYGEGDERQISFAHFARAQDDHDLPTLKVLGWDNRDTALHLDDVARELTAHLAWPEDDGNAEAWRKQWRAAFALGHREVVTTSRELSIRLAELARAIRDRIKTALAIESEKGALTQLMKAFQATLVHDLNADGFADMYAQTIAYGLLSARITDPHKKTADDFAAHMRTNPFLRELMETFLKVGGRRGKAGGQGIDFDELGVSEVIDLLDDANMEAVVRDFGDRNPQEDPVIHFYELFLKEYDAKKRMQRGVFYTPRPVVSYMVRSADELLRTDFGLADGLADTTTWGELAKRHDGLKIPEGVSPDQDFIQILDPATGTGTFLVEVTDLIHKTLVAKWKAQGHGAKKIEALWNEYVPKHLLTRLHGYELLMAPYTIAHLKIGLKLYETGYTFATDERARVYLTNALEPAQDFAGQFEFTIPALAHEATAVNQIKGHNRFTVVVGNPPYSDASQNLGPQFRPLIERFRYYKGERIRERGAIRFEHVINNDYVKFLGLSLGLLDRVPRAVCSMITSNSYLGGKSFRGVRDALRLATQRIRILDLHGEGWSGELARDGRVDENVFEIQTGVAICLMAKTGGPQAASVKYGEIAGTNDEKIKMLEEQPSPITAVPVQESPHSYDSFIPSQGEGYPEYWMFPRLDELFNVSVDGIKTSRDGLVVANTREACVAKIHDFANSNETQDVIENRLSFQFNRLDFRKARTHVAATFDERKVQRFAYRPFDIRFIYYDPELILSHRMNTMPRILNPEAEAIVCASRLSAKGFDHALAARSLCSNKYSSHDINSRMFLVVYEEADLSGLRLTSGVNRSMMMAGSPSMDVETVDGAKMFGHYVLAILHTPGYKGRYHDEIQQDFPRVPLPRSNSLFAQLAAVGAQISAAECLALEVPPDRYVFRGRIGETCDTFTLKDDQLWIGQRSFIEGVKRQLVEFRLAGYEVCKSWFTAGGRSGLARKDGEITKELIDGFRQMLFSVEETMRLRSKADTIIEAHGGWPEAFETSAAHQEVTRPVRKVAEPEGKYEKNDRKSNA